MEKLIELVVKCQKELKQGYSLWDTEGAIKNSKEILISKSFGFIKWLVDNDKIDFKKVYGGYYYIGKVSFWEDRVDCKETYNDEDALLMLLAISENPIEDLISYLK